MLLQNSLTQRFDLGWGGLLLVLLQHKVEQRVAEVLTYDAGQNDVNVQLVIGSVVVPE